jgi:hypothetical protein
MQRDVAIVQQERFGYDKAYSKVGLGNFKSLPSSPVFFSFKAVLCIYHVQGGVCGSSLFRRLDQASREHCFYAIFE